MVFNMKNILILMFISLFVININAQNLESIKQQLRNSGVDQNQAKKIANEQGLNDDQIKSELESRGISTNEKNQLQGQAANDINELDKDDNSIDNVEDLSIESTSIDSKLSSIHFGYEIFSGDPEAFQASDFGALDPNYNIGPGDQIIVMLWGESQFRQEFTVNREGYVFVPDVGQVFVNGLDLKSLEIKFFQILSKVYSTLNPSSGRPTTFIDISLGNLRPLRIIVLGDVSQPGAYAVSPSTTLSSSLYYFNGPTINGSLRDIRLIREGEIFGKIDYYNYLLYGSIPNDFRLQLDDIVFIPPRGKTVSIVGEIIREGIYELNINEGLNELIKIAGGLKISAYMDRAQINRIVKPDNRSDLNMDRMFIDVNLLQIVNNKENFEIYDGDSINIFPIQSMQKNYVSIKGSPVVRPGKYQLHKKMRLIDIIDRADGLTSNAYLNTCHIIRLKTDLTKELISVNLKKAYEGNLENNIMLQFMDEIIVYNNNYLKNVFKNITINGSVKLPGSYSLENGSTINDLIMVAGGFTVGIKRVRINVARYNPSNYKPTLHFFPSKSSYFTLEDMEDESSPSNKFLLKSNDIINIYSDPKDEKIKTVTILGEIYHPGNYPLLSKIEKVSNIINRAGGLKKEAYLKSSKYIRNNKEIRLSFEQIMKNNNSSDNISIIPGDTIIISKKYNIVEVRGEVNNPGFFNYYKDYRVKNYIEIAGGLNIDAEKNQIWITYPDGKSKKQRILSPIVIDGSIINVSRKEDGEPFDITEFSKEFSSIISDFLQIALTLILISNSSSG